MPQEAADFAMALTYFAQQLVPTDRLPLRRLCVVQGGHHPEPERGLTSKWLIRYTLSPRLQQQSQHMSATDIPKKHHREDHKKAREVLQQPRLRVVP